jgi:hypothetical protein
MRAQNPDSGHKKKQRSKGGLTSYCVVIFVQQQAIRNTALQLTQVDGKAFRHVFITVSVLLCPLSNA